MRYEVGFWTIFGLFLQNMKSLLGIFCGILASYRLKSHPQVISY